MTYAQSVLCPMALSVPAICPEPLCLHQVLRYCSISVDITPPSSLIRTHAPDQYPLVFSRFAVVDKSLQVAASPCWKSALPDFIPCNLCISVQTPTPPCTSGALAHFFPEVSGLTSLKTGSAHKTIPDMQL